METAELLHFFLFRIADRFRLEKHFLVLLRFRFIGLDAEILPENIPCEKLGVSAEQYVRSPPRHVGRYGYSFNPARLGDDLGLLSMLLGVENVVLKTDFLKVVAQFFRLARFEEVPTSTGRPAEFISFISAHAALNFSRSVLYTTSL